MQDLRRFSEAGEMQPLGQDRRMSWYDLFVNTLSQLRPDAADWYHSPSVLQKPVPLEASDER